jgi:hypothetical protein
MSNKIAVFAASIPLLLSAAGASGGELQFKTPTTERAEQTRPLLSRAAHAVHEKVSRTAGSRISNVWIFPTGDEHTVFAQYIVTTPQAASKLAASEVHLELLKMQGDRVIEARDLTRIAADSALSPGKPMVGATGRSRLTTATPGALPSTQTRTLGMGSPRHEYD